MALRKYSSHLSSDNMYLEGLVSHKYFRKRYMLLTLPYTHILFTSVLLWVYNSHLTHYVMCQILLFL